MRRWRGALGGRVGRPSTRHRQAGFGRWLLCQPTPLNALPLSLGPSSQVAAQRLGVDPAACLVIEDSTIGLAAALGAGMRCLVTYTNSTRSQDFAGADTVVASLEGVSFADLAAGKLAGKDDRVAAAAAGAGAQA